MNNTWDTTTYLGHEKFREALALAINREEIKDFIFEGKGVISGSGTAYGSWALGYKPVPLIPYDPKQAKQLVQEVVRESFPGKQPHIDIYVWKAGGIPETDRIGEALAGYWDKIGISTKIVATEYSSYRKEMSKKEPNLRNCVGVMRLPNRLLWDGGFKILYHSKGMLPMARDPKLDALIDALVEEKNPDMVGPRQYDVAMYLRKHYIQIPILECGVILAAHPKKVPVWPNLSVPLAQDFFLDDLYTR